jgi:hypothetical protein
MIIIETEHEIMSPTHLIGDIDREQRTVDTHAFAEIKFPQMPACLDQVCELYVFLVLHIRHVLSLEAGYYVFIRVQ